MIFIKVQKYNIFLDIKLSFITYKQKNNHQSLVEAN